VTHCWIETYDATIEVVASDKPGESISSVGERSGKTVAAVCDRRNNFKATPRAIVNQTEDRGVQADAESERKQR